MSEVLTEYPADSAGIVDTTTTVESTTSDHGEAHLADGTLLEEMKKAMKQSAFVIKVMSALLIFGAPCQKKVEFYFADANLPYDKCTGFLVLSFLFCAK
jgi:hypothetical protein